MFSFLKKFKKVKKAKGEFYVRDEHVFPKDYLFWADKEEKVSEDGVDFSYKHRDCFLGNADTYILDSTGSTETFGVKQITGRRNGFYPVVFEGDFLVKIPLSQELYEEYVMDIDNDFSLGGRSSDFYAVSDIRRYADENNAKARASAREKALSETKAKM